MYKLLIKKSFFDGWDNILAMFVSNVVFAALIFAFAFLQGTYWIYLIILGFSFHFCGVNGAAFNIVRSTNSWFEGYKNGIKKIRHILLFFVVFSICFIGILSLTPFYMSQGDFFWYCLGFFVFFASLITLPALFYFFPLSLHLEKDRPFKTLKKCFIVFFDNFVFSIYCVMKNIGDLFLSVFTAMLMPGFSGVAVTLNNAVMFFMLRYDWMEDKKIGKHNVSADMYLKPLIENMKERNLRTLFFPWKNS